MVKSVSLFHKSDKKVLRHKLINLTSFGSFCFSGAFPAKIHWFSNVFADTLK